MKRLFLTLLLALGLICNSFAQEKPKLFPPQGLQTYLGLDDTSTPPIVKDGRSADLQNIVLDSTGSATKRNGYAYYTSLDTNALVDDYEPVTGLYELYKSNGTRTKLAICGSKIFSIGSASKTDISLYATITEGQDYQFVWATALDYAIGTNGQDAPIQTNGTTTSGLTYTGLTYPIQKAKCVVWWKNYLIFGNITENSTAYTTRIRWSNVGKINTWSDDDYQDIASLGGQQIEGFATLYDNLYIFLTDSIYKISLVGGDELILVSKVSEGVGCIAKNSIQNIQIGNSEGLIFLSRDKTINYCDGVKVQEISTFISDQMDTLSAARLPYAVSIDDQQNAHYYLSITDSSASTNNLILDFHYGIGEWSKHTDINANAFMVANDANENPQVYFGNYDSFVYQMIDSDKNSDVAGETGTIDFNAIAKDIIDTETQSGVVVLYDTSATFSDVTGATVKITSGTGSGEEYTIVYAGGPLCTTGIVVVDSSITATGNSVYSIGAIDAYYTTKWYDLGLAPMRKNFGELFFWATTESDADLTVTYATDFSSTMTTSAIDLYAEGSLWGTAIWGTSTWGGISTSLTRVPLNVSGRFIKVRWRESDIDEPMELFGYNFAYWDLDIF